MPAEKYVKYFWQMGSGGDIIMFLSVYIAHEIFLPKTF